jgi:hypothetical protein
MDVSQRIHHLMTSPPENGQERELQEEGQNTEHHERKPLKQAKGQVSSQMPALDDCSLDSPVKSCGMRMSHKC